jgi:Tol biopolymer transport system component
LIAYERVDDPLASDSLPRIWLYNPDMNTTAPLFEDTQISDSSPVWNSTGEYMGFYDVRSQSIQIMNWRTTRKLAIPTLLDNTGAFSPDGSTLVFADIRQVGQQFFSELFFADLSDSTNLRPMFDKSEEDSNPTWSPDGRWIAFGRRQIDRHNGNGSQLMLLDVRARYLAMLTDDPAYNNTHFIWDPLSRYLLIQRFDLTAISPAPELWVYDLASKDFHKLADNATGAQWLP